jgi:peptidoglycan/xylan/chitin deacetylase (PgdA/CDA1 family)
MGGDVTACSAPNTFALTFDDGPSEFTPTLLATLTRLNVKATFLLVGQMINAYPGTAQSEQAAGYSTVSHTFSHPSLPSLSAQNVHTQMVQTEAAFKNAGALTAPLCVCVVVVHRARFRRWCASGSVSLLSLISRCVCGLVGTSLRMS